MTTRAIRKQAVPNVVLGMLVFLFTEVMLFCGLVASFVVLRYKAGIWPPEGQPRLPVAVTGLNTAVLIASAVAFGVAVKALTADDTNRFRARLQLAFGLGVAFLAIQGAEWASLIGYGLTTASSLYGALFYTVVGAHALHVLAALIALGVVLRRARAGRYTAVSHDGILAMRLYWYFVVAIWPPLYGVVYLW